MGGQQARNLAVRERLQGIRFVIRDRDAKYCCPFDEVLRIEGAKIIKTPIRSPRANAHAERWVRTAGAECLDWILVLGRRHLERVLRIYAAHNNRASPTEASSSRRRSRGLIRVHGHPTAHGSGSAMSWASSSMSANWLLDGRIAGFCALQRVRGEPDWVVPKSRWEQFEPDRLVESGAVAPAAGTADHGGTMSGAGPTRDRGNGAGRPRGRFGPEVAR